MQPLTSDKRRTQYSTDSPRIIRVRLASYFIALIATAVTFAKEPAITEVFDIAKVPAEFPVGFQLLTTPERQYVAYYDAERHMTIAARALDSTQWVRQKLPSQIIWDSHNYVTMALDSAGHLHVSGNMHCVPLIYFRTEKPGDITTLKPASMTGLLEDRVTYPRFFPDQEGRLIFTYRHGSSGNGINLYNRYDPQTKSWSRLLDTPLFDGEGKRNAYPSGPTRGPDGWFHIHWVWRDTPDCATNQQLSYARSRDLIHWESALGEKVDLPIRYDHTTFIVDPIPPGGGIINGGHRLAFDSQNKPVFAYHKSDANGHMQIYAACLHEGKWQHRALTQWKKTISFSGGGSMPFIGISVSDLQKNENDVFTVGYRHQDYGSGSLSFHAQTLHLLEKPLSTPVTIPRALRNIENSFPEIEIRRTGDTGSCGTPGVRYILQWETLGANRDRPRQPPLPAPSTLRLYKLTGAPHVPIDAE